MYSYGLLHAAFFALLGISSLYGQEARPGRVEVAVGDGCGVALKSDGGVWTWGAKGFAHPGREANNQWAPARVPGLSGIRHVAAGVDFVLALAADGTISIWGSGTPTAIHGLPRIVAIAAGGHHALALDSSGTVWNWGEGSGPLPQRVPDLAQVIAIAAGDRHSIALDASGHVWVWGEHGISDIDGGSSSNPRPIPGLSDITAVAGGELVTFGLRKDGTVWSIGSHDGSSPNKPARVAGLSGVKAVAARQQNAIALKADGTVWTWGDNRHSQLGNSAIHAESSSQAVRAGTLAGIVAIAAGGITWRRYPPEVWFGPGDGTKRAAWVSTPRISMRPMCPSKRDNRCHAIRRTAFSRRARVRRLKYLAARRQTIGSFGFAATTIRRPRRGKMSITGSVPRMVFPT